MKSDKTKEKIIGETIQLINETNGEIALVTIRRIAERAQIGIGLINHYFGSKERLIQIAVQQIIEQVVSSFRVDITSFTSSQEVTIAAATQVMDFLMKNAQISKVSILGDLMNPQDADNSMMTAKGFAFCMSRGKDVEQYKLEAFQLVSLMQEAFLRKDSFEKSFGINLYDKGQRDGYLRRVIQQLLGKENEGEL